MKLETPRTLFVSASSFCFSLQVGDLGTLPVVSPSKDKTCETHMHMHTPCKHIYNLKAADFRRFVLEPEGTEEQFPKEGKSTDVAPGDTILRRTDACLHKGFVHFQA